MEYISERPVFVAVFFIVDDLSLFDDSVGLMWPPGLVMKIFERRGGLDIRFNWTNEANKGFMVSMDYEAPRRDVSPPEKPEKRGHGQDDTSDDQSSLHITLEGQPMLGT